jgi:hypothetical protein
MPQTPTNPPTTARTEVGFGEIAKHVFSARRWYQSFSEAFERG